MNGRRRGIGMLFQRPPTISGLKLGKMLTAISKSKEENIPELARSVHMDKFLERDINKGFSGGEIKRSEVLQLMIQNPDFVMLDEPESGVDLENISLIGTAIGSLLEKEKHLIKRKKSGLVITHTGYILDYLDADKGHVMCDGEIKCHGNPREISKGYQTTGLQGVSRMPSPMKVPELSKADQDRIAQVGIDLAMRNRCGTLSSDGPGYRPG